MAGKTRLQGGAQGEELTVETGQNTTETEVWERDIETGLENETEV